MPMDAFARVKRKLYREDGKILVTLTVGDGCNAEEHEFLILDELLAEIGELGEGKELDAERVSELDFMAEATAAFSSASASLALAPCSARALSRKLCAKGFSKTACERAVGICLERGYIEETSTALHRAQLMVEKPWGRTRILAKLFEEGYSEKAINAVREYLDDVDFAEGCARVIEKKYRGAPDERREREKMFASLMRLGFSGADIKRALQKAYD